MRNLRGMAVFATVVDTGTFTAAAQRLGVAKSAVSRAVGELEHELGVVLLHRTTRRITPTEAGLRYYEGCARMVAAAEQAEAEVSDLRAEPAGLLRVSAGVAFGVNYVVPHLAEFAGRYPRLRVEIDLEDRYVDLIGEGIDLAIRAGQLADSSLIARQLAQVTSVVCGAPGYLERNGVPRKPADLARHEWVLYTPYSRRYTFRRNGRNQSVTVNARLSTNSGDATRALVLGGRGLSLMPTWFVQDDLAAGRLKAVLTDYSTRRSGIYAVYPEGKHILPRVRLFVESLAEHFSGQDWRTIRPGWVARA